MDISRQTLTALFTGFNSIFTKAFSAVKPDYKKIATVVPSKTAQNTYPWLGKIAGMREWIGDRFLQKLKAHDYSIKNRSFEVTVEVDRNDIEDDQVGLYAPVFENLGDAAARHPDELVFGALNDGFAQLCFDGQNYFDTDHPVGKEGQEVTVSNMEAGGDQAWFLLDTRRPIKPIIFQERKKPSKLIRKDSETDENVFMRKSYVYGTDSRCNVGYSFWQMGFGSKQPLTAATFKAARAAMRDFKGDDGESLNIEPNMIVVGNANADVAEDLFAASVINGTTNTLSKAVEVLRSSRIK